MTAARPGPAAGKRPSASAWIALTLCATLLVSASVVGLYVVQDRALTAATAIVRDLRQARIDLYQGFVHATLGGAPGSPWDRDRGLVLLEQGVADLQRVLRTRDNPAGRRLQHELADFLDILRRPGTPDARREVELRVAFYNLDLAAQRVDRQLRDELQHTRSTLAAAFWVVLCISGALLALVSLGAVRSGRRETAAMAAHLESETRFRQLAESIREVFWLRDLDEQRVLYVNPAYESIWGRSGAILASDPEAWLQAVHPDDRERVRARVPEQPAGGYDEEYRIVRPDGSERAIRDRAFPVRDDSGRVVRVAGVAEDITERKRAEARLEESLALLRATLASTDNGVLVGGPDGALLLWNGRMVELLGDPAVLHAGDDAAVFAALGLERLPHDGAATAQQVGRRADGSFIEWHSQPMVIDGRPAGRVWSFRDVTARERALADAQVREQELERRVKERTQAMAQAYAELQSFSDAVSHDLRAPLAAINAFAQALLRRDQGGLDAQARDHVERIVASCDNMRAMIEGLLELSRHARAPVHRQQLDLSAMAREAFELQAGTSQGARVEFRVEPGLQASGDAVLVATALQNLIGNALKYARGRDPARIEVGRGTADGQSFFFVRDNGAGFDPAQQERLFKPFSRLHLASEFEGHGIGLATVSRIVARHGGRVWASGAPGEGATFYFTLE